MPDQRLIYRHADVFTDRPFAGNGVTVFPFAGDLSAGAMQAITVEMRQFESIFLRTDPTERFARARVFTMEEELSFAGHPALGAACVLHELYAPDEGQSAWTIAFASGTCDLRVSAEDGRFTASMDQGTPEFGPTLEVSQLGAVVDGLSLDPGDLHPVYLPQVVSTGLPYLILPLQHGLDRCRIRTDNLEDLLAELGAKFVYVLDVEHTEGRTWDNAGTVEDVATGSAAGPTGAYLVANGLATAGCWLDINQGRFIGRPSVIKVRAKATAGRVTGVEISGSVVMVASGTLDEPPATGAAHE